MSNYLLQAGNQKRTCKNQLFITDYITGIVHIGDLKKLTFLIVKKPKR